MLYRRSLSSEVGESTELPLWQRNFLGISTHNIYRRLIAISQTFVVQVLVQYPIINLVYWSSVFRTGLDREAISYSLFSDKHPLAFCAYPTGSAYNHSSIGGAMGGIKSLSMT